jgi:hypothetical protein
MADRSGRRAQTRIWFNKSLSSIHGVLRQLRGGWGEGELIIVGSHTQRHFGPFAECDVTEVEPSLSGDEYVQWCLGFCLRHRINVFIPGRHRDVIADQAGIFVAAGVRLVVCGDGDTIRLLEDKGRFLEALPADVRTHRFARVRTWQEFEAAMERFSIGGSRLCMKPARGTFGIGFHVFNDHVTPLHRLLSSEPYAISRQELTGILKAAERFPELLVMDYLDGPEMSVDILACSGEVVALMVRRKPFIGHLRISGTSRTEWVDEGPYQVLDRHPKVEAMTRRLVAHFQLGGLLNIQFRSRAECPDEYCVLEINGRMSGGLSYVGLTGLNLPALAIKMALLDPGASWPTFPEPKLPLRIGTRTEAFAVPEES